MSRRPREQWHRLSDIDLTIKEAKCSQCGQVRIIVHSPGSYACVNGKDETRRRTQVRAHGLTPDQAANYINFIGACEICETREHLVVDHDHVTLRRRGVLCRRCNSILGYIETPALREPFDKYLRSYGELHVS